jgi:cell division septation protein DedD
MTAIVELCSHLLELLFKQKKAIIPEIGTFEFSKVPAELDAQENKILPPYQDLKFYPYSYSGDCISLENFLISEKNYTPEDASTQIKAMSYQLKRGLADYQKVYLPYFGSLVQSDSGISFEPGDDLKTMISVQDPVALHLTPIPRSYQGTEEKTIGKNTFVDPDSSAVKSEKNRWVLPLIIAFLILGIGLIAFFVYREQINHTPDLVPVDTLTVSDNTALGDTTLYDTTRVTDTANAFVPADTLNSNVPPPADTQNTMSQNTTKTEEYVPDDSSVHSDMPATTSQQCAVIVGVMAQKQNVVKLSHRIRKMGYTPFSYVSKGLTRIGAATACDEESIARTMADMKTISKDAWLYSK